MYDTLRKSVLECDKGMWHLCIQWVVITVRK